MESSFHFIILCPDCTAHIPRCEILRGAAGVFQRGDTGQLYIFTDILFKEAAMNNNSLTQWKKKIKEAKREEERLEGKKRNQGRKKGSGPATWSKYSQGFLRQELPVSLQQHPPPHTPAHRCWASNLRTRGLLRNYISLFLKKF